MSRNLLGGFGVRHDGSPVGSTGPPDGAGLRFDRSMSDGPVGMLLCRSVTHAVHGGRCARESAEEAGSFRQIHQSSSRLALPANMHAGYGTTRACLDPPAGLPCNHGIVAGQHRRSRMDSGRRFRHLLAPVFLLATLYPGCAPETEPRSLAEALAVALRAHKPVLVDFYSEG